LREERTGRGKIIEEKGGEGERVYAQRKKERWKGEGRGTGRLMRKKRGRPGQEGNQLGKRGKRKEEILTILPWEGEGRQLEPRKEETQRRRRKERRRDG